MAELLIQKRPEKGLRRSSGKMQRFNAITRAANKLFRSQGYGYTSIQEVAEEAEVSPATVYNYFGTKIAILNALIEPDLTRVRQSAAAVLANLPESPIAGIVALSHCYQLSPEWINRDLLMPFAEEFFFSKDAIENPLNIAVKAKTRDILKLVKFYKDQGTLSKRVNEEDVVVIILSLFQYHLKKMLLTDDVDIAYKDGLLSLSDLDRQVKCAVSGVFEVS